MKPILEWYEELPEPIRSQSIANYDGDLECTDTLHVAIQMGFAWGSSPEKHDYWYSVYQNCIDDVYIQTTLEQSLSNLTKTLEEMKESIEQVRKAIRNENN